MFLLQLVSACVLMATVTGNQDVTGSTTCLQPRDMPQNRNVPFEDLGMGSSVERFTSGAQVIVTSYTFMCCGRIQLWQTYVDPGGDEDGEYDITFQVWRPNANTESDGCYSLVGDNEFLDIDLGRGGLVCEAPRTAQEEISVQPGDVVGFQGFHRRGGNRGIQISTEYTDESVWHAVNPSATGNPQCMYPVGTGNGRVLQSFNNNAPILSVTVAIENCPTSPPTTRPATTTQPTSAPPSNSNGTELPPDSIVMTTPTTFIEIIIRPFGPSPGAIAAIIAAVILTIALPTAVIVILCVNWWMKRKGTQQTNIAELKNNLAYNLHSDPTTDENNQLTNMSELNNNLAYNALSPEHSQGDPTTDGDNQLSHNRAGELSDSLTCNALYMAHSHRDHTTNGDDTGQNMNRNVMLTHAEINTKREFENDTSDSCEYIEPNVPSSTSATQTTAIDNEDLSENQLLYASVMVDKRASTKVSPKKPIVPVVPYAVVNTPQIPPTGTSKVRGLSARATNLIAVGKRAKSARPIVNDSQLSPEVNSNPSARATNPIVPYAVGRRPKNDSTVPQTPPTKNAKVRSLSAQATNLLLPYAVSWRPKSAKPIANSPQQPSVANANVHSSPAADATDHIVPYAVGRRARSDSPTDIDVVQNKAYKKVQFSDDTGIDMVRNKVYKSSH